jgi:hypothetical protein
VQDSFVQFSMDLNDGLPVACGAAPLQEQGAAFALLKRQWHEDRLIRRSTEAPVAADAAHWVSTPCSLVNDAMLSSLCSLAFLCSCVRFLF